MQRSIVAPADLGGALDELKAWLGVRSAADDAALEAQLRAACEACEAFTGAMPLTATCEEIVPASFDWQRLAAGPVVAITSVEGVPAEGARFALPADAYAIDIDGDGTGRVRVSRPGAAGRVAVRFVAGRAPTWELLPEGLRQGIVRLAAHSWRARESGEDTAPPAAVAAVWRPWRRMRL